MTIDSKDNQVKRRKGTPPLDYFISIRVTHDPGHSSTLTPTGNWHISVYRWGKGYATVHARRYVKTGEHGRRQR